MARDLNDDKPPELGSDAVSILEGSTFMLSDPIGDVPEGAVAGLFHQDTRYLNRWELTVDGQRPALLTSGTVDYFSASFNLTNPRLEASDVPANALSIQRFRFIGDGMREDLSVENHLAKPVRVQLRVAVGVDFADLFEVKDQIRGKEGVLERFHGSSRGDEDHRELAFEYTNREFFAATRVHPSEPAAIDGDDLVFDLSLEPRERWTTSLQVAFTCHGAILEPGQENFEDPEREAALVLRKWNEDVPRFEAGMDLLEHVYAKSVLDLAALRLRSSKGMHLAALPAAGLPWFMAVFGRDTLVTSYQSLLVGPDLARGALEALASMQGTEVNDFRDEEPGKILHEIRFGEQASLGVKPHSPYYGTNDATPLWLILLSEYWRFTGDDAFARALRPNAERALEWIDRFGDRDGDGYVEYDTRSSQGLENQGWKDSWDGILRADGSLPPRPLALCEIQGYVYDAKVRMAELASKAWGDEAMAGRLGEEVKLLYDRFNREYWTDERGGFYVVGLDGDKNQVNSKTSNMGHLLWSGIVPPDRADVVVRQLFGEDLFTGWGIRTLSSQNASYNPIGYHTGTVWPHDNSLISAGLVRYGFREEANRIAMAHFDASAFTDYRLPEVFGGYPRAAGRFPIRYPTACSPQAWATAAPFLWLRLMLGIDAADGSVTCDPVIPAEVGRMRFHGIHAFGTHVDVEGEGSSGQVTLTT